MRRPENLNAMDRLLLRVTAPIEFWTASLARGVSNLAADYFYLVDVKGENARLAYENARLRETVHRLEGREAENGELRRLLQLKETTPGETASALVVGTNFTEFFRVSRVVLDRGARDVRARMPVVVPDGVVGTVLRVNGNAVDVQLSTDAAFGIDVEDVRTRARGFVRGTGDPKRYACRVEMVDARDEVEVGDLLVTSGKGKWFPRGLPVARVTKVIKRELGRDQEVEAVPTVNFSRIDAVLILLTPPLDDVAVDPLPKPKGGR
ncbi:MAG: rod shape-determining protein MreC [Myxococcales bacterium]|nr:rod shape-determining protein MreC [Myxococcales bacterium]